MLYKKGDKVKIKKCKVGVEYGGWIFERLNKRYIGKTAKIVRVNKSTYDLDIDDGILYWTDEMLVPVKKVRKPIKEKKWNGNYDPLDNDSIKWEKDLRNKIDKELSKPKSLNELEVGDWVESEDGIKYEIIKVWRDYGVRTLSGVETFCQSRLLKEYGYKQCPPPQETLEINGKTYLKDEVLEAVRNLKEII